MTRTTLPELVQTSDIQNDTLLLVRRSGQTTDEKAQAQTFLNYVTSNATTDDIVQGTTNKYDQTVTLSAGTNISSIAGTYPNFTINAATQTMSPPGTSGDFILNNSGAFGVYDGVRVNLTGDARGSLALDIQSARSVSTQVASGSDSIAIGANNTASNVRSIGIGRSNTASQIDAVAIGTSNNIVSSFLTCVAMGIENTVGEYSSSANTTAIGFQNKINLQNSLGIGASNHTSNTVGIAIGRSNRTGGNGVNNVALGLNLVGYEDNSCIVGASTTTVGGNFSGFHMTQSGISSFHLSPLSRHHFGGNVLVTNTTSLGSELVTNGTFTGSATGWTLGTNWSYFSNTVRKTAGAAGILSQTVPLTVGKYYFLVFTINGTLGDLGTVTVSMGGTTLSALPVMWGAARPFRFVIRATSTAALQFDASSTAAPTIDNVSVKEITGGDVETPLGGPVLTSPGGTRYRIVVDNAGALSTVVVP